MSPVEAAIGILHLGTAAIAGALAAISVRADRRDRVAPLAYLSIGLATIGGGAAIVGIGGITVGLDQSIRLVHAVFLLAGLTMLLRSVTIA